MGIFSKRILIVDDDSKLGNALSFGFQRKGWKTSTAKDGYQAIRRSQEFNPDIILMDFEMPGRDGITTSRIIRGDISDYYIPILLMCDSPDKNTILKSVEAGCDDFISKPLKFNVLFSKVENLIEFQNKRKGKGDLGEQKEKKEAEIITYTKKIIQKAFSHAHHGKLIAYPVINNIVKKMITILHEGKSLPLALEMKSHNDYTYNHSINMSLLCMTFAYHLKWNKEDLRILGEGGLLHDIGKTAVDVRIIIKPGRLTDHEFAEVKKHPEFSKEILARQNVNREVQNMVYEHHEYSDGSGYPRKICNGQICKHARVAAIVDMYDALTTDRCYKNAIDSEDAIKKMTEHHNKFDPELFGQFSELVKNYIIGK